MNQYQIFKLVNSPFIILVRAVLLLGLLIIIFILRENTTWLDAALYVYALLIINELYIHLKVNATKPPKTTLTSDNWEETTDWKVRSELENNTTKQYIQNIKNNMPQKFVQDKIGQYIDTPQEIPKDKILQEAQTLAKSSNSTYITEMTIFASYLVLQEEATGYLERNQLSVDDIPYLLFWVHKRYPPRIEKSKETGLAGGGVFDFFVYGWNAELQKYAYDFTSQSLKWGASAHAVGRVDEYDMMVKALLKGSNNNVLLLGNPGVGKTSLVGFLAKECYNARIPGKLARAKIYALALDRILSGADNQGEVEKRLTTLLAEIAHSGNVLIYMPNIELLFGGGGLNTDLSGALYDYMRNGQLQCIGTTTVDEYETRIKPHASHVALFETITLEEPDAREARFMIFESITHLEKSYKTTFTYKAIVAAIDLADEYQTNLMLPGSCLVLLEDVAQDTSLSGAKAITQAEVMERVQKKTNIPLHDPDQGEKDTLLHLEETLKAEVVGQDNAVIAVADAMRRVRSGFRDENKPIATFLFLGPTGVGKTQTAKALARVYFGDSKNMIRLDMSEYNTPDSVKKLLGEMPGDTYIDSLIAKIKAQPFTLLLLDEFEKADSKVQDIFLQVLDDARLTNNKGETASFENTIIIATSNAGSEYIRENESDPNLAKNLQEHVMKNNLFKPELLNRFTQVVTFMPLGEDSMQKVVLLDLTDTVEDLKKEHIKLSIDEKALQKIATEGYDKEFGARNIQRYIKNNVESMIAKEILEGKMNKGQDNVLTLDASGNFAIVVKEP